MSKSSNTKAIRNIEIGNAFQFAVNGEVFVKCADGYRPGRGGELKSCHPKTKVIPFNPG
jgi:hypothetical protein